MCARDTGATPATGFLPEEVINAPARLYTPSPRLMTAMLQKQPVAAPELRALNHALEAGLVPSSAAHQLL